MLLFIFSMSIRMFDVMSPNALRETKLMLRFEAKLEGAPLFDPFDDLEFLLIPLFSAFNLRIIA